MSRRPLILLLLAAMGLGAVLFFSGSRPPPEVAAPLAESKIKRHAFLDDLDLDAPGADYAVLLHPQATGSGTRAVLDNDVIRAAQGKAFYTDDPTTALKRTLLSIVFLSPAGSPPNNVFVSIIRNKEIAQTYLCYVSYCNGSYDTDTPHTRDLAGLLAASVPVEYVMKDFAHHDQARAAHFRALRDPEIVLIEPPDLPAPSTVVYPNRLRLSLPAQLIETDAQTGQPVIPFDEPLFEARFAAAFEYAFPDTEAYRLSSMDFALTYPPTQGWPVVSDRFETRYLQDEKGNLLGLDRIALMQPILYIDLIPDLAQRLQEPGAFSDMPEFSLEPEDLSARLDALAADVLGEPCPGCFQIELPVSSLDGIKVEKSAPASYTLHYYEVASDEPAAQQ